MRILELLPRSEPVATRLHLFLLNDETEVMQRRERRGGGFERWCHRQGARGGVVLEEIDQRLQTVSIHARMSLRQGIAAVRVVRRGHTM
jgi:hypothetical protein